MSNESTELNSDLIAPPPNLVRRENAPGAITDNKGTVATGGNAAIHDRTGLYIAILALALGGMGLGFEISRAMSASEMRAVQDQAIDMRIQAGAANTLAVANQARTDARLALEQKNEDRTRMAVLEDRLNRSK